MLHRWRRIACAIAFASLLQPGLQSTSHAQQAAEDRFDASMLQAPQYASALYYGDKDARQLRSSAAFTSYIAGLLTMLDDKIVFLEGGAKCVPMVAGTTRRSNLQDIVKHSESMNGATFVEGNGRGSSDMLALFTRYKCQSEVITTILGNLNAVYGVGSLRVANRPADKAAGPASPKASDRQVPEMCAKSYGLWRKNGPTYPGYGAYVVGAQNCGWSVDRRTALKARQAAMEHCQKATSDCVLYETHEP